MTSTSQPAQSSQPSELEQTLALFQIVRLNYIGDDLQPGNYGVAIVSRGSVLAVSLGHLGILRRLIPYLLDSGHNLLPITTETAVYGQVEVFKFLMEQLRERHLPLSDHIDGCILDAASLPCYQIIELILRSEEIATSKDYLNETARIVARRRDSDRILDMLIKAGADNREEMIYSKIEIDDLEGLIQLLDDEHKINTDMIVTAVVRQFGRLVEYKAYDFLILNFLITGFDGYQQYLEFFLELADTVAEQNNNADGMVKALLESKGVAKVIEIPAAESSEPVSN